MILPRQGLRLRIFAILGVLFLVIFAVQGAAVHFYLLDRFVETERRQVSSGLEQALGALDDLRAEVAGLAAHLATHEALHRLLAPRFPGSTAGSDGSALLGELGLDALFLIDAQGRMVLARSRSAGADGASEFPAAAARFVRSRSTEIRAAKDHGVVARIGDVPLILAGHPVMGPDDGTQRGLLVIARRLDRTPILAQEAGEALHLTLVRPQALAEGARSALQGAGATGMVAVGAGNGAVAGLRAVETGLDGRPLVLRARPGTPIVAQGRELMIQLQLLGVVFALALFLTLLVLLNRLVLRRVGRLDQRVGAVGAGRPVRVAEPGEPRDELGRLATTIDGTFAQLHAVQHGLRESEEHFRTLAESIDGAIILQRERILYCNPAATTITGYSRDELLGRSILDLVHPDHREEERGRIRDRLDGTPGPGPRHELKIVTRSGEVRWLDVFAAPLSYKGQTTILNACFDITEYKRIQATLRQEKARVQATLESIGDGVITTDTASVIDYMNPVAEQLTGWSLREARGRHLEDVLTIINENTRQLMNDPTARCLQQGGSVTMNGHALLVSRGGEREYSIEAMASPMHDENGCLTGAALALHDVTELRGLARHMAYQAAHDSLTDLVNRREFEARLEQCVAAARHESSRHALCYLDLDQFKVVNDTCGHVAGDTLLRQLAALLRRHVRSGDTLARLGGDEFGLLFRDCSLEIARQLADKLRTVIREFRFVWQGMVFDVGCSIGLVMITDESPEYTEVLSLADAACYLAKEHGRNRIHVYQSDDVALIRQQGEMRWMQRIQRAIEEERFVLYVQRIVSLKGDGEIAPTSEVLLRMLDADGSVIEPRQFLAAAERYTLMPAIDRWVVHQTIRALRRERRNRREAPPSVYSVNLSGQTLCEEGFLRYVVDLLEQNEVDPRQLCFELTETAVVSNLVLAKRFIGVLRNLGCRFALDDFGSGLSSFAYLKSLPMDFLKIDGQFVRAMFTGSVDRAVVEAINELGRVVGMRTIAEFVESEQLLGAVKELDVDYAQGNFIEEPRPMFALARAPERKAE